jgi:hypothetical protein
MYGVCRGLCWRYIDPRTLLLHIFCIPASGRVCVCVCVCVSGRTLFFMSGSCRPERHVHSTEKSKRICVSVCDYLCESLPCRFSIRGGYIECIMYILYV